MSKARTYYRIIRSILFSTIIAVGVLYAALYIFLSFPPAQRVIKGIAEKELSSLLESKLEIGNLNIIPFNEVRLKDVVLYTPEGEKCISIGTLGAGINLWRLISKKEIEITYAEILDLDGKIWQVAPDKDINIQFLINAFASKDKNKPPKKFDLKIHNIVIRRSNLSYDKLWIPRKGEYPMKFDPAHISIYDLMADVTLPVLKNDDFLIDLRRLSFKERSGVDVNKISFKTHIGPESLSINNLILNIGESRLRTSDFTIKYPSLNQISKALDGSINLAVIGENILPSDFAAFFPPLKSLPGIYYLDLDVLSNNASMDIKRLVVRDNRSGMKIETSGIVDNLNDPKLVSFSSDLFSLMLPSEMPSSIMDLFPQIPLKTKEMVSRLGRIAVDCKGSYSAENGAASLSGTFSSALGKLGFDLKGAQDNNTYKFEDFNIEIGDFDLGTLLNEDRLGFLSMTGNGNINIKGKDVNGDVEANIEHVDLLGRRITNIEVEGSKSRDEVNLNLNVNDPSAILEVSGVGHIAGARPEIALNGKVESFRPAAFGLITKYGNSDLSTDFIVDVSGKSLDDVLGSVVISDFKFHPGENTGFKPLDINKFDFSIESLEALQVDEGKSKNSFPIARKATINSDFMTGVIYGKFTLDGIKNISSLVIEKALPGMIPTKVNNLKSPSGYCNMQLTFLPDQEIYEFLKLPLRPLTSIDVTAKMDMEKTNVSLNVSAPYLLQGTNKLISGFKTDLTGSGASGLDITLAVTMPVKKDRLTLGSNISAKDGNSEVELSWQSENDPTANGKLKLDGFIRKQKNTKEIEAGVHVIPSQFHLGEADWNISDAYISYNTNKLNVDGLRIWHESQYVDIRGAVSKMPEDALDIALNEIDLGYIFGILNINYVTFGGFASGEITASEVFSKNPVALTKKLSVRDFSYNDALLGDAEIFSRWNNENKAVEISADIAESGIRRARVDGGVFVTRDSLDFSMRADKIKVGFLKPFMAAFTSDVGGRASGDIRLFGNFKDIDLVGRAFADSIYMKVDYTNVYYHGSDSVILDPGKIIIPSFRLKDKYGQEGIFSGVVRHSYFHNPEFEFKLSNANSILCYDTDSDINPDWYGRIFASGGGSLWGRPGIVALMMDMTNEKGSDFTFVLNETQTATDYTFLSFSDRKKEEALESIQIEETLEDKFKKSTEETTGKPSVFTMDLRATVTPDAKMTLVMDPKTGDRIAAHGSGPLQISYDTESEEMKMYGKYTLSEGDYKFNLQDLILRDFIIKEGSNISFNGDPLRALLDVSAAYRVNTNLSDLDKSFSSDKDLNRTNVPVDAVLNVKGDLESPEITFDIELPTLTSDVARKIRSIISTDEMMNRQIIYLLALNRFYTPEYMGGSSNGGGELASVASSTISSQLSNIIGSLTDKVTFMPSIRSDKGDFSDMEVDLTLSSRLLNNRLLVNGNFGYRDKNTSQTTFVGDFDIEYLLNRNGDLRLKAYNHFNDQYYYLKSALTTQGIGILYRKEFDNPFTFLRRKKKPKSELVEKEDNKSE